MSESRGGGLLREVCRLPTSGARAAAVFDLDGAVHLAVPQLAYDLPGARPYMNGGDSDTDLLIYRWEGERFSEVDRLPAPGGEDAEIFEIGGETFLAVASARSGKGPYEPNIDSVVYRRDGGSWREMQRVPTFFAKQWRHIPIGDRHFLGLAIGVTVEGPVATNPAHSMILEWTGQRFEPFQTLEAPWGYNWCPFEADGRRFLAYADHIAPSRILEWDGSSFVPFQTLEAPTGRAFQVLRAGGRLQLAFATIAGETQVLDWTGDRFEPAQTLGGPGGREFATTTVDGTPYLVLVRFIEGTPAAPRTDLRSVIFRWDGQRWTEAETFPTFGATDASFFTRGGRTYLVVTNSLTAEIRFRQDTVVYEFLG